MRKLLILTVLSMATGMTCLASLPPSTVLAEPPAVEEPTSVRVTPATLAPLPPITPIAPLARVSRQNLVRAQLAAWEAKVIDKEPLQAVCGEPGFRAAFPGECANVTRQEGTAVAHAPESVDRCREQGNDDVVECTLLRLACTIPEEGELNQDTRAMCETLHLPVITR